MKSYSPTLSMPSLEDLIVRLKAEVIGVGMRRLENRTKLTATHSDFIHRFRLLSGLITELSSYRKNLIQGIKSCVPEESMQMLIEQASRLTCTTPVQPGRVTVSDIPLAEFLQTNPQCADAEDWAELKYNLCANMQIEVDIKPVISCDLDIIYSVKKETDGICDLAIQVETKPEVCDLMVVMEQTQKLCNLNIETKVTPQQCEIEFQKIIKAYPGCNLTIEQFTSMVACNITPVFTKTALACNMEISHNIESKVTTLCSKDLTLTLQSGSFVPDPSFLTFSFNPESSPDWQALSVNANRLINEINRTVR